MRDAENSFKPRPTSVVRDNMEPVMLPGNGLITRGVTAYTGENFEDAVEESIQMSTGSLRNAVATRGREISTIRSTRPFQGQGKLVDLTESRNESGNVSTDSDRPLIFNPQGVLTRIKAERKATEDHPRNYKQAHSPSNATTATATSTTGYTALNNTPLPDDHEIKFLAQARRDHPFARPPFVRLNRGQGVLGPKRVTLATPDGQFPQTEIPTNLSIWEWDAISSFYTIDINGERLIVKPMEGRFNHANRGGAQYRAWSGQGNTYESTPVAFEIKDNAEDQQRNVKDSDGYLAHKVDEQVVDDLDAVHDEDYVPPSSEGSSPKDEGERGSGFQEITAGKRQAPDAPLDDRSWKKGRPQRVNATISDTAVARVPPTLTIYKQERTILYVFLPGSASDMVAIKLRSAMSLSSLFSSVCSAVGIKEYVNLAIAVMDREEGGPDGSMIIRRDSIEAFEVFLEAVDEAPCWREEGGKLSFRLHLKAMVEVERAMRV